MNLRNFKGDKEGKEKETVDPEKAEQDKKKQEQEFKEENDISNLSSHNNSGFDLTRKKIQ